MRNQIIIGDPAAPIHVLGDADLLSVRGVLASSLTVDELAADELRFSVDCAAAVDLPQLPYGIPVRYYFSGTMVGKFYFSSIKRTGKTRFDVTATSAVGILSGKMHAGGMYTGQSVSAVVADIIGDDVTVSIEPQLAELPVHNWLPYQSRRENLHQVLLALGATVTKDRNGDMLLGFSTSATVRRVSDGEIFFGGSIDYQNPADSIRVTEHSFLALANDELITLFDNSDGASSTDESTVIFREAPVHDLETTGTLEVLESNCNYAVVRGYGVLMGRKYTHATRVISRQLDGTVKPQKLVSVTDAYLVSALNSRNVADRLLSYYSSAQTLSADIILQGEKPGDMLALNDPFGMPVTAFLREMSIEASSFLRAACELVVGYKPTNVGNNYNQTFTLRGTGTWQVPAQFVGTQALVVVIGGGQGGGNGLPGQAGSPGTSKANGLGGAGGKRGQGGAGGRILVQEVTLGSSYAYRCGFGGLGAEAGEEAAEGTPGTASTFGELSSANGETFPVGIVNLITGQLLAGTGEDGVDGGDGSQADPVLVGTNVILQGGRRGGSVSYNGQVTRPGADGTSMTYALFGAGAGAGGGAAAGADGLPGTNGIAINFDDPEISADSDIRIEGGSGGAGADAAEPEDEDIPGKGGRGGNGGGGGGGGGGAGFLAVGYGKLTPGPGGEGGDPSGGSRGGNGAILIYVGMGGAAATYSVDNYLEYASSDNTAAKVEAGGSYTATITPWDGYTLKSITVTMGGLDVTDEAVDGSEIKVEAVDGDIIITAAAEKKQNLWRPGDTGRRSHYLWWAPDHRDKRGVITWKKI